MMELFQQEHGDRPPIPDVTHRSIGTERWEDLREFRASHPPKRTTVSEVVWDYIASGDGE
jgi:hypothetical protein